MLDIPGGAIPSRLKFQQIFAEQLEVLGKLFLLLVPFPILFFFWELGKAFPGFSPFPVFPAGSVPSDSSSLRFPALAPEIQGMQMIPSLRSPGKRERFKGNEFSLEKNPLEVQDFLKIRGKPKEGKYSGNIPIFPISCILS